MGKFVIAPHMRLLEWVARDKGYFDRVGLDYELSDQLTSADGKLHDLGDKVGLPDLRAWPQLEHQLRLSLDDQRRGVSRSWEAVIRRWPNIFN
jgi:hypothetical protein